MESCLCSFFLYPKVLTLLCGKQSVRKIFFNSQGNTVIEKVRPIPSKKKINSYVMFHPPTRSFPNYEQNQGKRIND